MLECDQEGIPIQEANPALLKRIYDKMERAGVPVTASIELTERCNLHCTHCYLGEQENLRPRRSQELTSEQWIELFEQLADLGVLKLLFTGGDPFLRKDFAKLYRHARTSGFFVSIFTNGTLLTSNWIELFRELPPNSVEITLYGASREVYQRITGVDGSYDACLRGIEMLKEAGIPVGLKSVALKENRTEFGAIAAFCRSHSDFEFRWDTEMLGGFQGEVDPLESRLSVEEAIEVEFSDEVRRGHWQKYFDARRGQGVKDPERLFVCGALKGGVHVNPYGKLQPCVSVRALSEDLTSSRLEPALVRLRERLHSLRAPRGFRCASCNLRAVCSSCPAASLLENGRIDEIPFFQCQMTQARNDILIKMEDNS